GALGVREEPPSPVLRTLLDYLRPRRLLLLIDNCEHVIAASAQLIEAILQACPKGTVQRASRKALALAGEVAWRVPSLTLPDEEPQSIDQDLPDSSAVSEAVQLFVD